jgi:hypothetical protein
MHELRTAIAAGTLAETVSGFHSRRRRQPE